MKLSNTIILSLFIFFSSCGNNESDVITEKTPEEKKIIDSALNVILGEQTSEEDYPEFDINKVDTVLYLTNDRILKIEVCDSLFIQDYIDDDQTLKTISRQFGNSHESALAIEKYLEKSNKGIFKRDSIGLNLLLGNETWKRLSINDTFEEADNTFEHYFRDYGFYSVRTQYGEGNGFRLIEVKTGLETKINGRPYFSKNGKFILTVICDIEAGYSFNGFELFTNKNGKLKELIEYNPYNWGCIAAKWINDSTVVIKNESYQKQFYTKLTIKNKE